MFKNDEHEIIYITPDMMHKYYNNNIPYNNYSNYSNYSNYVKNINNIIKQDYNKNTVNNMKQIIFTLLLCLFFIYILQ